MVYVLVVEDEPDARETLASLVELRSRHRVVTAVDGADALAKMRAEGPPCLILLDLAMPTMTGWQLRLELIGPADFVNVPIVLVSGLADLEQHARILRVVGYLHKPIDLEKLDDVLRQYCPAP